MRECNRTRKKVKLRESRGVCSSGREKKNIVWVFEGEMLRNMISKPPKYKWMERNLVRIINETILPNCYHSSLKHNWKAVEAKF